MSPLRVDLKSKILKEVRLILGLIAIPMGIIIYNVFIKPPPKKKLSNSPTYCQSIKHDKKELINVE